MKNIFLLLIFITLFNNCGYFENDGVQYEDRITGNFALQKQRNSDEIEFAFLETPENSCIIIQNCGKLYYDSVKQLVFSEEIINEFNSNYYKISIFDTTNRNNRLIPYKKRLITEDKFKIEIEKLNKDYIASFRTMRNLKKRD